MLPWKGGGKPKGKLLHRCNFLTPSLTIHYRQQIFSATQFPVNVNATVHFTEVEWMSDGWGLRRLNRGPGSRNVGPTWRARSDLKESFFVCNSRKQDNLCLSQNQSNKSTTDLLRWSDSSWSTMVMKVLMWVESKMAVLPKSPGYIRKWLANTESAEVPLCAQALIGSMVSSVGNKPWLLLSRKCIQ